MFSRLLRRFSTKKTTSLEPDYKSICLTSSTNDSGIQVTVQRLSFDHLITKMNDQMWNCVIIFSQVLQGIIVYRIVLYSASSRVNRLDALPMCKTPWVKLGLERGKWRRETAWKKIRANRRRKCILKRGRDNNWGKGSRLNQSFFCAELRGQVYLRNEVGD